MGKGQHLGSREGWDGIPVELGKAGMSQRGGRAVLALGAELRVDGLARDASGTPKPFSKIPGFFFFPKEIVLEGHLHVPMTRIIWSMQEFSVPRSDTGSAEAAYHGGASVTCWEALSCGFYFDLIQESHGIINMESSPSLNRAPAPRKSCKHLVRKDKHFIPERTFLRRFGKEWLGSPLPWGRLSLDVSHRQQCSAPSPLCH